MYRLKRAMVTKDRQLMGNTIPLSWEKTLLWLWGASEGNHDSVALKRMMSKSPSQNVGIE